MSGSFSPLFPYALLRLCGTFTLIKEYDRECSQFFVSVCRPVYFFGHIAPAYLFLFRATYWDAILLWLFWFFTLAWSSGFSSISPFCHVLRSWDNENIVFPVYSLKTWESGGIAPLILISATWWSDWSALRTGRFTRWTETVTVLASEPVGTFWKRKKSFAPWENRTVTSRSSAR